MAVWTISAQEGTGGDRVAAELAASAGVPLLDRGTLALIAHDLDPEHVDAEDLDEIERRCGGRFKLAALSMAITTAPAATAAVEELQFRHNLPELGRAVVTEAARRPCVILAPAAFAALPEHPGTIHVRLRAPLGYRIAAYQRDHVADRRRAEKSVKRDDHMKAAWVRSLYQVELDDSRNFTVVLDASRFTPARLVDVLLAAGGVHAALPAS